MKKSRDVIFYKNYIYKNNYEDPDRIFIISISKNLIILESDILINFNNIILRIIKNIEINNAKTFPT